MDRFRESFLESLFEGAGHLLGAAIVWVTLLVFVATFVLVLWVAMRRRLPGFQINVNFENATGSSAPREAAPSPRAGAGSATSKRELPRLYPAGQQEAGSNEGSLLAALERSGTAAASISRALIGALMLGATWLMAVVVFEYPDDGNRDFMLLYGGVLYVVAMLSLGSKLTSLRRREAARRSNEPGLLDQLRSKAQVQVESGSPEVFRLDAQAMERARAHVAAGGSVEEACEIVDPRYRDLPSWSKAMFRRALEMAMADGG